MAKYIGNARVLEIFTANVRDDLIPNGVDVTFELSQQVPGGHEENVMVMRRKFNTYEILTDSSVVDFDNNEITSSNANASLLLSTINPGEKIIINGSLSNDGEYTVTNVSYDDPNITITVSASLTTELGSSNIDVTQGVIEQWELLEPTVDYIIEGSGAQIHKLITLSEVLTEDDYCYVIHRGEATYNFVPSPASVGPDQLQVNLRNFVTDRFDAVSETNFVLSQEAVNSTTLEVTLDGVVQEGRNASEVGFGVWELNTAGTEIDFDSSVTGRVVIKHLGFSTVSRRASLNSIDTANITNGSVDSTKLSTDAVTTSKIQDGAVTKPKIADNAVDGNKILLNNDEYLNALDTLSSEEGLLKLNSSDETVLNSPNDLISAIADAVITRLSTTELLPENDDTISLGNATKRFKDARFSGNIENDGNITTHGNILLDSGDTVDGVDVSDLAARVTTLEASSEKPGMMKMWAKNSAPPTGWLLCNGQVVSQTTYADLFAEIGSSFNQGGEGPGDFRVPDFRQRFPIGKADSGTGSNWGNLGRGGAIDHTHIGGTHTHTMAHTHSVPAHYHGMGTGADLNITSSGSHTTSIAHSHPASSVGSGGSHQHTVLGLGISGGAHSHVVETSDSPGLTAESSGSEHAHLINATTGWSANTGTEFARTSGGTGNDRDTGFPGTPGFDDDDDGAHDHRVSGTVSNSGSAHTHTVNGTVGSTSEPSSSHSHSLLIGDNVPVNSVSSGNHIHTSGNFSGSIGLVSGGVDGNASMSSGAASVSTTSSSGAVATSSNNPPYQVINFIIKT